MVTSTKNEIQNRNCPKCNKKLKYNSRCNLLHANKMKALCRKCACNEPSRIEKIRKAHLGQKRPASVGEKISKIKMGHSVSEETRMKLRNANLGKKHTEESKQKMSKNHTKYWLGKTRSEETKQKMRISAIKRIERDKLNGGQWCPNYNSTACILFDWANMYHDLYIQHAENGGEIKLDVGYWPDGYDKENNTIYEYYENFHKYTKKHDEKRKQRIVEHLDCEFIEIKEWEKS